MEGKDGKSFKVVNCRLSTYIADPRQELNTTDLRQTFRDIKIDGVAVPFLLCLR